MASYEYYQFKVRGNPVYPFDRKISRYLNPGIILLAFGLLLVGYFAVVYTTTEFYDFQWHYSLDKIQNRNIGVIVGLGLGITGAILAMRARSARNSEDRRD